jgi:hypothetical protein
MAEQSSVGAWVGLEGVNPALTVQGRGESHGVVAKIGADVEEHASRAEKSTEMVDIPRVLIRNPENFYPLFRWISRLGKLR